MTVTKSDLVLKTNRPTDQFDLWEPECVFYPNWTTPLRFTTRYQTVIHTSRTGLESRTGLTSKPLRSMEYETLTLSESDIDNYRNVIERNAEARTLFPLFSESGKVGRLIDPQTGTYELNVDSRSRLSSGASDDIWTLLLERDDTAKSTNVEAVEIGDTGVTGSSFVKLGGFEETYGAAPPRITRGALISTALTNFGNPQQTITAECLYSSMSPADPVIETGDYMFVVLTMEYSPTGNQGTMDSLEIRGKDGSGPSQTINLTDDKIAETIFNSNNWPLTNRREKYIYRIKLGQAVVDQADSDGGYEVVFKRTPPSSGSATGMQYATLAAFALKASDLDDKYPFPDDLAGNSVQSNAFTSQPTTSPSPNTWYGQIPNEASIEVHVAWGDTIDANAFNPSTSTVSYTGTTDKPFFYIQNSGGTSVGTVASHSVGTGSFALAQRFEVASHAAYTKNPASQTYEYTSTFTPNSSGKVEGSFARIRLNPKVQDAGKRNTTSVHAAMECDLSFNQTSSVINRHVSTAVINADETPGLTALDPLVPIGTTTAFLVNTVQYSLGPDAGGAEKIIDVPILEASPDYTGVEVNANVTGDEGQVGVGRKRYRYGGSKMFFQLPYTCLDKDSAYNLINFFQSRGGRLLPFFLTPPVTQFEVDSIQSVVNTAVTVKDNGLVDGENYSSRDRIIGKHLSFYDKSTETYYVRKIKDVSSGGSGLVKITLDGTVGIADNLTGVNIDRCGIAHLCRFDSDEMTESWITTKHMQTTFTAIELLDEKQIDIEVPRHIAANVCAAHPCTAGEPGVTCPEVPDDELGDSPQCQYPIFNNRGRRTYLCGFECKCGTNSNPNNVGETEVCGLCSPTINMRKWGRFQCCNTNPATQCPYERAVTGEEFADFEFEFAGCGLAWGGGPADGGTASDGVTDCRDWISSNFPSLPLGQGDDKRKAWYYSEPLCDDSNCNGLTGNIDCCKRAWLSCDVGFRDESSTEETTVLQNQTCEEDFKCDVPVRQKRWRLDENYLNTNCLWGNGVLDGGPEHDCYGKLESNGLGQPTGNNLACTSYNECTRNDTVGNRCECGDFYQGSCSAAAKFETDFTRVTVFNALQKECIINWYPVWQICNCAIYSSCISGAEDPNAYTPSQGGCE